MNAEEFRASLTQEAPCKELSAPLTALWWDAKGDWSRAHTLVDELETLAGMAVHAYLHRKEGSTSPGTGTSALDATFTAPRSRPSGRHWSRAYCPMR